MEAPMFRTNVNRAQPAACAANDQSSVDACSSEAAAEAKAKRIVNTVSTLRILVPVALITALVISGRLPDIRIDNAMATIAETSALTNAASQNYFPGQDVNQGTGGEEQIPT